jgi:Alpha-L-arabinofuranosidase B, catalytic
MNKWSLELGSSVAALLMAAGGLVACGAESASEEEVAVGDQRQSLAPGTVLSYEAETLSRTASAIGSRVSNEAGASGGAYVELKAGAAQNAWVELTTPDIPAGLYDLKFLFKSNTNRGIVQASVDGVNQGATCNEYASAPAFRVACNLGSKTLTAGTHRIRFTVVGKAGSSSGHQMTVDQVSLTAKATGPCDIYAAANTPCVAAYSTVRALSVGYTGPLYQVRSGSSASNTGSGGTTKDIGVLADGLADSAAQDAFCANTYCTISKLYDQSGRGNHLTVGKKGTAEGGMFSATDDFESTANRGPINAGGRKVYSLFTAVREGYRLAAVGNGMPVGSAAQGIYLLADGTHSGTACCWDFGNVTADPTKYAISNALMLGTAFWGRGAGAGPWFLADFGVGIWAGGSKPGDPGWGSFADPHPANLNNPALKVPFALGFLKTNSNQYSLRMADAQTATAITTAYEGAPPVTLNNKGGIVLGVDGNNANNSFGTFYEGAILAGYPSSNADLEVLQNVRAVGYSK